MKIPIFPGKYHQNGGFSMAMLVSGRVSFEAFEVGKGWQGKKSLTNPNPDD